MFMARSHICIEYTGNLVPDEGQWDVTLYCSVIADILSSRFLCPPPPSLHRSCACRQLQAQCVRWQVCLCRAYYAGQGHLSTATMSAQVLSQGLHAQPNEYDQISRLASARHGDEKVIQPYESHMQYLAQWMCDYNLYGCAYIDCSQVKFEILCRIRWK
jgi:hypothetical protein